MTKKITVLVATHKTYAMPEKHSVYLPIHVGSQGKESIGYTGDDTGDHISHLNPYFCELTGLYWAWKNVDADYIGLAHYRRHFTNQRTTYNDRIDVNAVVLTKKAMLEAFQIADIIVPQKRHYYIETLYSHYVHTFDAKHLDNTRAIIEQRYPEYLNAYDQTMKQRSGYMFNMFIMSKEKLDAYCEWLFNILNPLFEMIPTDQMTAFEARYPGRVSELLFNVWLNYHGYNVVEKPFLYFDKVNWFVKGTAFLKAKFMGKKYDKSF